jgi:thymidylate kinase
VDVASIIDAAATSRVLVTGSLPPLGRDYDLLVGEFDVAAVESALATHGFKPIANRWMRIAAARVEMVELVAASDWHLCDRELEELFARALPLAGRIHLCTPAPVHQLLILAGKLPRTPGVLEPKHLQRVSDALARAPDALEQARERAQVWGVKRRLRRLESRCAHPRRARWLSQHLRRPRRGAIVALSGLDGVGKSTQAQMLQAALDRLGYRAVVVWAPLGSSEWLRRFARAVKQLLARLPAGPLAHADAATVEHRLLSQTPTGARADWRLRRLAVSLWSTVIALANAASYRRSAVGARTGGRVVIWDRYVLDSIVELRFSYAPAGRLPLQETLIRRLAPVPSCAFLLDMDPERAHQRKPDWSLADTSLRAQLYRRVYERLDVRRIDATRSPEELAAEILGEVLATIGR